MQTPNITLVDKGEKRKELQLGTQRVLSNILARKQTPKAVEEPKTGRQKPETRSMKQPTKHTLKAKSLRKKPASETNTNTDIRTFFARSSKGTTATKERELDGALGNNNKSKSNSNDHLTTNKTYK